ncbi:MAG TPA: aminotransferase class IV [Patescibacteria group bacterium]|nr:aminotransferase class IV [Patescibacteria group bacterium]
MIHRLISHNGQLLPVEDARLSPGQEGLINGWGLFTTLRTFHGQLFAFERHWRRLQRDAKRVHIPLVQDPERIYADVCEVIRANQAQESAVRIYIIWNRTSMWHSDEPFPPVDIVITSCPMPTYREPVRLDVREHCRHAASPLAGVKTIAWINNVWNLHEAKERGFDEVVLLNERGEVSECTAANLLAVRAGEVLTPPLSSGCLAGITREVLLEISPRAGIPIREAVLKPEDLYAADEVLISSTNRNLIGVSEVAGHKIPVAPGPMTRKLSKLFSEYVDEDLARSSGSVRPPEQPIAKPSGR